MSETQMYMDQAWTGLEAIVGSEQMHPASAADAVDGIQSAGVIAPSTAEDVAQVLRHCSFLGSAVVPRGGGTKLGLGNRPRKADFILSTERLNRLVEHAWGDMTATVEAGCTIDSFQHGLKEHGQRLAVDPLWPERATIGGLLATADSGTLRIRYGTVRDLVLGVEMALTNGNVIKAGGKVVKNVAGYDLCKLVIGSLGTLGVITRAVFRLHPLPAATATYSTVLPAAPAATQLVLAILDSHLVYTGLQLRAQQSDRMAVDIRFEGVPESLQDQYMKLNRIAREHSFAESSEEVWEARQKLFVNAGSSVIAKCSVLPARIGSLCHAVFGQAHSVSVALVAQGTGLAEVRLDAGRPQQQIEALTALRAELVRLEGTLIVQQCPVEIKEQLDVWGTLKDAFFLMQLIKQKFDPAGTLNPGRFVGTL